MSEGEDTARQSQLKTPINTCPAERRPGASPGWCWEQQEGAGGAWIRAPGLSPAVSGSQCPHSRAGTR